MTYPLAASTWGDEERQAILDVVDSGRYTMGEKVSQFEKEYAKWVNAKYAVMVNSGSSANLLMVAAMSLRQGTGTVIVPAISWATSYAPFQQYGWKLRFVDVDRKTLNYDIDALNKVYTGDELILAVNLLGNPNAFREFPSMVCLEDNCESMGAEYAGMKTGNFGVMASHSTFFSHHMCTMEGGLITTDDEYFYQMLLCLRSHGWTRHLSKDNVLNAKVGAYDFIYPGYNVRPIEMAGAVGIAQLKKLPAFIKQRRENAKGFQELAVRRGWQFQHVPDWGDSSWFAFAILTDEIQTLKAELDAKGIEHRPVVAGNFLRSPSLYHYDYEESTGCPNADYVHDYGLYIGNHHQPIDWSLLESA